MFTKIQKLLCCYLLLFSLACPVSAMALEPQEPSANDSADHTNTSVGDSSQSSQGDTSGDSSGSSQSDASGDSSRSSQSDASGDSSGSSQGDTSGDSSPSSQGDTSGDSSPSSQGDASGDSSRSSQGDTSGNSSGSSQGDTSGNSSGSSQGDALGDSSQSSQGDALGDSSQSSQGDTSGDSSGSSQGDTLGDSSGSSQGNASGDSSPSSQGDASGDSSGSSQGNALDTSLETSQEGTLGNFSGTPQDGTSEASEIPQYTVTLSQADIPSTGELYFTTVDASFANRPLPPGIYAGSLTIEITEPIYIPSGVSLGIGTLSIGGPEERPRIKGQFTDTSLITLAEGASLTLQCVDFDITGNGTLLTQENGASFLCTDTNIPTDWIATAPPVVNHINQAPADIWLPEGTALDSGKLPASLQTYVQQNGTETKQEIAIQWDFASYDGRTSGEMVLSGTFLDANGKPMASLIPLEITVHWYQPEVLSIQEIHWKGNQSTSLEWIVPHLPETFQAVWGEISTDGQKTWNTLDLVLEQTNIDNSIYVFSVPSGTAYHCRLAALDTEGKMWYSESVQRTDEGDDTEGNRGGATTPNAPDRTPTFPSDTAPQPETSPETSERPKKTETNAVQTMPSPTENATSGTSRWTNRTMSIVPVHLQTIAQTPVPNATQDASQNEVTSVVLEPYPLTQLETIKTSENTKNSKNTNTENHDAPVFSAQDHTETPSAFDSAQNTETAQTKSLTADTESIASVAPDTDASQLETKPAPWKQGVWIAAGVLVCIAAAVKLTHPNCFRRTK